MRTRRLAACGRTRDLPVPVQGACEHARVCDHAGSTDRSHNATCRVAFRFGNSVGTRDYRTFAARWLACSSPCRRFARVLAATPARLGASVGRYSFTVEDLHLLLLAGLPAHYPIRVIAPACAPFGLSGPPEGGPRPTLPLLSSFGAGVSPRPEERCPRLRAPTDAVSRSSGLAALAEGGQQGRSPK